MSVLQWVWNTRYLCKIIVFLLFSWLVDKSADASSFEFVRDKKVLHVDVLGFLVLDFHPFLSKWIALVLSSLIVTSDPKGFNEEFTSIDLSCD